MGRSRLIPAHPLTDDIADWVRRSVYYRNDLGWRGCMSIPGQERREREAGSKNCEVDFVELEHGISPIGIGRLLSNLTLIIIASILTIVNIFLHYMSYLIAFLLILSPKIIRGR